VSVSSARFSMSMASMMLTAVGSSFPPAPFTSRRLTTLGPRAQTELERRKARVRSGKSMFRCLPSHRLLLRPSGQVRSTPGENKSVPTMGGIAGTSPLDRPRTCSSFVGGQNQRPEYPYRRLFGT
jgi:hypothetical protein